MTGSTAAIDLAGLFPWVGLGLALIAFLLIDLFGFARGREPTFREGVGWSLGWLAVSLAATGVVLALDDGAAAVTYLTVYLIERSLSLDNLFVFLLLFAYFGIPQAHRAKLLFWGIVAALVLRGLAILGGLALLERFEFVVYVLAVVLLILAVRLFRGVQENIDPDRTLVVRAVRRLFPVDTHKDTERWFVRRGERLHVTPVFLCLVAIVGADIAFAVDSIPAAFAITRESVLIWMGNVFALLGLRALFVLVDQLIRRIRYLDETIALVLALVAVKLLLEGVIHIGPLLSLAVIALAFAVGITASLIADRRDRGGEEEADDEGDRPSAAASTRT
jgi:tellurite resistance protein TerC